MMKELIVLVADKNMQFAMEGLLTRHQAFQMRRLTRRDFDIYVHPLRDPGVFKEAAAFLRPYQRQYQYALVLLDREGSGQEKKTASEIADEIKTNLERNGWRKRAEVIVPDPELEIWAWANSPHLATHTGWAELRSLMNFVKNSGTWEADASKPERPKEAFEALLREKKIQRSSSIYRKIATDVSFRDCTDPAFLKIKTVLREWFHPGNNYE
ncbi:hypothetical protein QUF72_05670 [Desulfobacterales bacterium HSG2]|nr:hypothetical protein [Desulfobacterales bacterium HSG2]